MSDLEDVKRLLGEALNHIKMRNGVALGLAMQEVTDALSLLENMEEPLTERFQIQIDKYNEMIALLTEMKRMIEEPSDEEPEEGAMLNLVICPGRFDEKGKLRMVCKEDCSHSVPHERRNACDVHNEPFCSPCILVEPTKDPGDRQATQLFVIFNVLTGYCGPDFTADKIDAAMADIEKEISEGGCDWAFKEPEKEGE